MYGNPPCSQVVDSQHTADDIPTKVVENKNFPYWISVGVQDGCGFGDEAVCRRGIMLAGRRLMRGMIEVEDFSQQRWTQESVSIGNLEGPGPEKAYLLADLVEIAIALPS